MKLFSANQIILDAKDSYQKLQHIIENYKDTPFLYQGRDENIKDVIYHLVAWHHILLNLVKTNPSLPFELKPGYTWKNLEALNYSIQKEAASLSLEAVLSVFAHTHQSIMDWVKDLSKEVLNTRGYYPFTSPSNLGEFIHECMGGHYDWAIQSIEYHMGDASLRPLFKSLSTVDGIEAIVLGGSRGKGLGDALSDYDIYVYAKNPIPVEIRQQIMSPFMSLMEYNNQFFETEDDGILKNGLGIEFIYRNLSDFKLMMEKLFNLEVNRGYSTCFLDNLLTSKIIYDPQKSYRNLQDTYRFKDKQDLYSKIITQNIPLIYGTQPALFDQVVKAVKRQDYPAVNHRLAEYFSLYFDTLFAINHVNHPGEKRMLEKAVSLPKKPVNLKERVDRIFKELTKDSYLEDLKLLSLELIELSKKA